MNPLGKSDVTVIILAAGAVLNRLPSLMVSCESPALIPIHTKPASRHLIEFYQARVEKIIIVVDAKELETVKSRLGQIPPNVEVVGTSAEGGVCNTLQWVFETQALSKEVVVNLVTSIVTEFPEPNKIQVAETDPWILKKAAVVRVRNDGLEFYGKVDEKPEGGVAFTGVFRCEARFIRNCFDKLESTNDLMSVVRAMAKEGHEWAGQPTKWIDCGHEGNLTEARASLITSRTFNSLEVDFPKKVITKASSNREKLRIEFDYLEQLPSTLNLFFPRVLSGDFSKDTIASYTMEYCAWPNASEYFLFWQLSQECWWRFFSEIDVILRQFRSYPHSISFEDYSSFLVGKTIHRIEDYLRKLPSDIRLKLTGDVTLNGEKLMPMEEMMAGYSEAVLQNYEPNSFSVFHGDLCFNNILFSWDNGRLRLIDPRGSFGDGCPGLAGDYRYDLAKLNHSACRGYDWIISGRYHLELGEDQHELTLPAEDLNTPYEEMMSWLCEQQGTDRNFVEILTGGLFLSMCPLHEEDSLRQIAFFLNGRKILSEALRSKK